MIKSKILVSACLLGQPVRYDGSGKMVETPLFTQWRAEGRFVGFCPEIAGNLPIPRPPAEIEGGADGNAVLAGAARILTQTGEDVTAAFVAGARAALDRARDTGCRFAILMEKSPSCGSSFTYNGRFSGQLEPGFGVTTALLRRDGIAVFSQNDLAKLETALADAERGQH